MIIRSTSQRSISQHSRIVIDRLPSSVLSSKSQRNRQSCLPFKHDAGHDTSLIFRVWSLAKPEANLEDRCRAASRHHSM